MTILVLLSACGATRMSGDGGDKAPALATPGAFALARGEGLTRDEMKIATSFDLGAIGTTEDFYFFLLNTGDTEITGVSLASTNAAFMVSPSTIASIKPDGAGVLPVVRVRTIHGRINTGFAPVLPAGKNEATLKITGVAAATGATETTTNLELSAALSVTAQIVDFTMTEGNLSWNMKTATFAGTALADLASDAPVITNTGNVPLEVSFLTQLGVITADPSPQGKVTVAPGASATLTPSSNCSRAYIASVKSNPVVTVDPNKLEIYPDGAVNFGLVAAACPGRRPQ